MLDSYWSLLAGVAPVFIIIAAGFSIRRLGWLTAESDQSLVRLTINLLYPCLIFDSILGNNALNNIRTVILAPAIGLLTIVIGLALCVLGARLLPVNDRQGRTFAFTVGIYNYGYIPVFLVQKFYNKETMGMLFTFNLGVEIAFWTAGIYVLTRSPAGSGGWRRLMNGPVLAIVFSLILNFCRAYEWLPSFFLTPVHMLGQSCVPLALLLTGATLADLFLQTHRPRTPGIVALGGCVLRLAIIPVIMLLIAKLVPGPVELKRILVVQAAMPAAMLPLVIAKHYGGDPDIAMQVILSTTVVGLPALDPARAAFHRDMKADFQVVS